MGPDNQQTDLYTKHGAKYIQHAVPNDIDKYDTSIREVKDWLNDIYLTLISLDPVADFPVMFHCRVGKLRTGVVIACLLTLLGFPQDLVIEEFLLCKNAKRQDIENSLKNVTKNLKNYFRKINVTKLQAIIYGA
jgi:protein tyrosine/serine phosphatase